MSDPVAVHEEGGTPSAELGAMIRGRRYVSLAMIAAGLLYTAAALQLDRGELARPGPGLFPILVGVLAVLAGVGGLLELRRGEAGAVGEPMAGGPKPWIFVAAMSLGVVLLPTMGFFVSALVCGAAVSWTAGQKSVVKALLTGLGVAVVSSILFVRVLDVYLPSSTLDRLFL